MARGAELAAAAIADGADAIAIGEMGIGNTASAALIMHRLAPAPLDQCVGAGAGQDEAGMARKRAALARAAARSAATAAARGAVRVRRLRDRHDGGRACSAPRRSAGRCWSTASSRAPPRSRRSGSTAAARDYCVFAHQSAERGHARLLEAVGAQPLLALGMRLGEGTGAVLAAPLLRAAARLLTDVADLSEVVPG